MILRLTSPALTVTALLMFSGCASFSPDWGLDRVSTLAGVDATAVATPDDEARVRSIVEPALKKPLTVDSAAQIALLNNKELQAAYNGLGLSEAAMWEASLPPNPRFSLSRIAGGGSVEAEARVLTNILALATLPARADIARDRFAQAQYEAANATLRTAAQARSAYVRSVAARQQVRFLEQAQDAAKAAATLATRLGEAGSVNKLDQARQQVFYAELSTQLASARLRADREREGLIRALGLWGEDLRFQLPAELPNLPSRVIAMPQVEREAVARRLDVQMARLEVEALAKTYGLTQSTRMLNLLEVSGVSKTSDDGANSLTQKGFDAEFSIPLFDFGAIGSRKAEQAYMQAVNRLAAKAVNVRSQAREAYTVYRASYDIARHYQSEVMPLRKIISDETLLRYNAMQIDVFTVLEDARRRISTTSAAIDAQRDYHLAQIALSSAILGGDASSSTPEANAGSAPAEAGGH